MDGEIVGETIIKFLDMWGVEYAFVYPGHSNLPLLYAIKHRSNIKGIMVRREDQAVFMADAYWRIRRSPPPAIAVVTTGPGIANALPAIANAFFDSSSLIVLAGITPTKWMDRGRLEETYRYAPEQWIEVMRPITKKALMIPRPDLTLEMLVRAVNVSINGRPGPVSIHIPFDILYHRLEKPLNMPNPKDYIRSFKPAPDPGAVDAAAHLLIRSQRPLIIAGGGVHNSQAWEELRAFSEEFSIPVATTMKGKGSLPETHPLCLGVVGVNGTGPATKAASEADLIIAIGVRFSEKTTIGYSLFKIPSETKLIHIDIDPSEINRIYPADVAIYSDASLALRALGERVRALLGKRSLPPESWLNLLNQYRSEWIDKVTSLIDSNTTPIHYARVFRDLSEVIGEVDKYTSILYDTGLTQYYAPPFLIAHSRYISTNSHWAQMGFSVAGILGAKLANPEHPAIAIAGDGSFFMTGYSVATAYEYDIPAVWIILNNYATYIETELMKEILGSEAFTVFMKEKTKTPWNPDIVQWATSMGAKAMRISRPDDLKPIFREALKLNEPMVLEVITARVEIYRVSRYIDIKGSPIPTSFT
jgi:acetolactate synthase-1/2/3 large subunit